MHRLLALVSVIAILRATSHKRADATIGPDDQVAAAQGSTPSPLAPLPTGGHCTHADTVVTRGGITMTIHSNQYRNDSAARLITVVVGVAPTPTMMMTYVGVRDRSEPRAVGVIIAFHPSGEIERAERQGQQQPFLVHDSTLAKMLFREVQTRCAITK